jgi:hypothetical protein
MAKEFKTEPETDFYRLSTSIQEIGYDPVEIDGSMILVYPREFNYGDRANGTRYLKGISPAKGIIKDLSGRIISETEEGFTGLTDIQMWQLANAGIITLSTKQERGHITRFKKYIKDNISSQTSTDY